MIIGREKNLQQLREAARGDGDFDSLHRVHMECGRGHTRSLGTLRNCFHRIDMYCNGFFVPPLTFCLLSSRLGIGYACTSLFSLLRKLYLDPRKSP